MNAVCWAPEGAGVLQLACAASDGRATILAHDATSGEWAASSFLASPRPHVLQLVPRRSDGVRDGRGRARPAPRDRRVRRARQGLAPRGPERGRVGPGAVANGGKAHTGWVRDVAFSPFYGEPKPCLISCSDDKSVLVWTRNDLNGPWASRVVTTCDAPVWRVAWSVAGCVLAVSSGDDAVSLWKRASPATGTSSQSPRRRPPRRAPGRLGKRGPRRRPEGTMRTAIGCVDSAGKWASASRRHSGPEISLPGGPALPVIPGASQAHSASDQRSLEMGWSQSPILIYISESLSSPDLDSV